MAPARRRGLIQLWMEARFFHAHDMRRFVAFAILNAALLVIRLSATKVNAIYLVHSIVIFTDLILANMFIPSLRLNTIFILIVSLFVVLYTIYGEFLLELLESFTVAFTASMYDLRKKYKQHLHHGVPDLQRTFSKSSNSGSFSAISESAQPKQEPLLTRSGSSVGHGHPYRAGVRVDMPKRRKFKEMIREAMLENVE